LKLQITIEGKTYVAEVEVLDDGSSDEQPEAVGARTLPAGAYTPSRATETHSPDEKVYHSPLNGLVIRVNVVPGQKIEAGDLLLVLEAMKMETSITAHHAGTVKIVSVKPGDSVKTHQVLVELE
jgi:methylmalonyl-CoA carboxyltransferase small subunit